LSVPSDVYEFTYRLGETNFFAENYMTSIAYYKWVRDHRELSETRFEKAARSIIQAYQAEIERQVKTGQLKLDLQLTTSDEVQAASRYTESIEDATDYLAGMTDRFALAYVAEHS